MGRRVDALGPLAAAEWRATQLVALILAADLDAGAGQWSEGIALQPLATASRSGLAVDVAEQALDRLVAAGVAALTGAVDDPVRMLRVGDEFLIGGMTAAVAWARVVGVLEGVSSALLVARAIADRADRPGQPVVVSNSLLARLTRYSEGMVKLGVAAAIRAGVVDQHPRAGRAPAFVFRDWALGRTDAGVRPEATPSDAAATLRQGTALPSAAPVSRPLRAMADVAATQRGDEGMLRVTLAGVSADIPAITGGSLVVRTEVDGRLVTAKLTIPPGGPR